MATIIDVTTIQTLDAAIAVYEKISMEATMTTDPKEKKEMSKEMNKLFLYVFKNFKTRAAHLFLWESVPKDSFVASRVGQWEQGLQL
ncbi:MAG: hypothetical protein HYT94_05335 [Parcubacteria group bacterium]|nr:hypothetical protein [Parcubacteria group bacterium]